MNRIKKNFSITNIIILLFIVELIFGLDGRWLMLGGISIRHWLFAVVLLLLYGKALYTFWKNWKEKRQEGIKFLDFLKSELATFSKFDWGLLFFVLLHGIWIVWIPYTQRLASPGVFTNAIRSSLSISIIAIYYPAVYLLRKGKVQWNSYCNIVKYCLIASCIWHILLYILERIQWDTDHTYYFMERVFNWWEQIVQGNCAFPLILMPKYGVRIIYACNIFIPMILYFVFESKGKKKAVLTALMIVALFTTGSRALILGIIVGVVLVLFLDFAIHKWDKTMIKKILLNGCLLLLFAVIIDSAFFKGMNFTRLAASFSVSEEVLEQGQPQVLEWTSSEYSIESEFRGTSNSNSTRILQIKELVGKFLEKPWLGNGFTLPVYDMQGVAFIAKVGLVGLLLWCFFLFALFYRVIRLEKKKRGGALLVIYAVTVILVDVMLQCMFGSLTMAIAVFLFLDLEDKELKLQQQSIES